MKIAGVAVVNKMVGVMLERQSAVVKKPFQEVSIG